MKEEKQPPDFLAEWKAQLHWLNDPICGNHQNWGWGVGVGLDIGCREMPALCIYRLDGGQVENLIEPVSTSLKWGDDG